MSSKYATQRESPDRTQTNKYLCADGTWKDPSGGSVTNRIIAGVVRYSNGNWSVFSDSEHSPINLNGASGNTLGRCKITYPTYSKVNSLVVTPDETFAKAGIKCGASVGLAYSDIDLRQDRIVRIGINVGSNESNVIVTDKATGSETPLTNYSVSFINHATLGKYIRIESDDIVKGIVPQALTEFNYYILGQNNNYLNFQFAQKDGTLLTDYSNRYFEIGWTLLGAEPKLTDAQLASGNLWIYGIMEA